MIRGIVLLNTGNKGISPLLERDILSYEAKGFKVVEVTRLMGVYDGLVSVEADELSQIGNFVVNFLYQHPEVLKTTTLPFLSSSLDT